MGPVHDNRCPTPGCEARFSSYAEYQDHATQHGHLGFKCGWCDEVFETMGKSIQYRHGHPNVEFQLPLLLMKNPQF